MQFVLASNSKASFDLLAGPVDFKKSCKDRANIWILIVILLLVIKKVDWMQFISRQTER